MSTLHWKYSAGIALIAAMSLGGCRLDTGTAPTQVAVVDLVVVAKALGRDEAMDQRLMEATEQLNAQLQEIASDYSSQLEDEKKKLGKKPEKEDEQRLTTLTQQARLQIQQTRLLAEQKAAQFRTRLIQDFRNEVGDVAAGIAKSRGASQVLVAGANTLWFDPSADITDEVIAKLRARPKQSPAATTPEDAKPSQEGVAADTQS